MVHALARLLAALAPLALTGAFGWAVAQGRPNFGGGEKDILLTAPLLLWSLIYLVCCALLWAQGLALARSAALAAGVATGLTLIAWIALFVYSWIVHGP